MKPRLLSYAKASDWSYVKSKSIKITCNTSDKPN